MTKFNIGDKVRIKKVLGTINHETNKPFKKNDITTVTNIITDYHVRVGYGLNSQGSGNVMYVENLELVDDGKKVYTEEDIYEGMVLECVYKVSDWWTIGQKYVITKKLELLDNDGFKHTTKSVLMYLNGEDTTLKFKVVEPEEDQVIDDKLTHLHSIVITVPKKDASGSYVNYDRVLSSCESDVLLSKCDRLHSLDFAEELINIELIDVDLVWLAKSMNPVIRELRNLNQTKLDLKLNGQHFILDTQEEMDYSTTLINGLIGNI